MLRVMNVMIKPLCLLLFTLFAGIVCKADTIDYWHVYYNKTKIKEFNQFNGSALLVLKKAAIKKGDSLTIRYFRDTPCFDCMTSLAAEDAKHHIIVNGHGKGTGNPVSFSLADLFDPKRQSRYDSFEVYYSEDSHRKKRVLLFHIKLE